jgi:hypothetical protein
MSKQYSAFLPVPYLDTGPNFPVAAYPNDLRRAAIAVQKLTQAPGELVLNSILCAIATTYQRHYDVEGLNGNPIPISINMLAVSPSGEGKTSAQNIIYKPITEYSMKIEALSNIGIEDWYITHAEWNRIQEKLSARKTKMIIDGKNIDDIEAIILAHYKLRHSKPRKARLISSDATPAGLRVWLADGLGCGLVLNSDAGNLINGPLLLEASLLCDIWSGGNITVDRGNAHLTISNPRLTVSLMTQPPFIEQMLQKNGKSYRGSGLSGRFLFYQPVSRIGRRQLGAQLDEEDKDFLNQYYQHITASLERHYGDGQNVVASRTIVKMTPTARAFLVNAAQNIEVQMGPGGIFCFMPEFATKMVEHVCRIAALLTLYEGIEEDGISLENVQRATDIVDYFARQYAATHSPYFGPVRDIVNANELFGFMMTKGQFGMYDVPRTLIMQNAPAYLRKKNNLDTAINLLIQNGRIVMCLIPGKRSGNSRMAYRVTNPTPLPLPQF